MARKRSSKEAFSTPSADLGARRRVSRAAFAALPREPEDQPFAARFGARMRDLRLERGVSLATLRKAGGLTPSQMSSAERGRVSVTIGTVAAVARALGVPPFLLLAFPENDALAAVLEEIRQAYGGDLPRAAEVISARLAAFEGDISVPALSTRHE